MDCLRCAFPWSQAPCPLCGWSGDPRYVYGGYEPQPHDCYWITVKLPASELEPSQLADEVKPCNIITLKQDAYLLYSLNQVANLFGSIQQLASTNHITILFNGSAFPYGQELWLPFLRFFESCPG